MRQSDSVDFPAEDADINRRAHADLVRSARFPRALKPGYTAYTAGLGGVWLRRPLVLTAVCLLTGDLMGLNGGISPYIWGIGAAAAMLTALFMMLIRRRPRVWLLLLCIVTLGGFMGTCAMTPPPLPPEGEAYIEGRIAAISKADDRRAVVDIDRLKVNGTGYAGRMRLSLYKYKLDDGAQENAQILPDGADIGARVALFGEVTLPEGQRSYMGFDYRAYLMRRNVYSCGRGPMSGAQFSATGTLGFAALCQHMRAAVNERLHSALGRSAPLAAGIMLGNRDDMPEDIYEDFKKAGFGHILAVSGMHVSFVLMLLSFFLSPFPVKCRTVIMIGAVILYGMLTGFAVSVVRAGIMGITALLMHEAGRSYDAPSALALAMLIILCAAPGMAMETGFALSFGSVAALLAYYPCIRKLIPLSPIKPHENASKLCIIAAHIGNRSINAIASGTMLSLSVSLGILPLTSMYFGNVNLMSIALSAFALAPCMGVLCFGWLSVLLSGWTGALGSAVAQAAGICAELAEAIAGWTADCSFAMFDVRAISPWWLLAFVLLMLCASRFRPLSNVWRGVSVSAALLLCIILLLPPRAGSGMDYVMVDVGQGDGQLFTDGASAIALDVGTERSGLRDYVRRRGLKLNEVIITHLHDDHAGALEELAELTGLRKVYLSENTEHAADEDALNQLEKLRRQGVEIAYLHTGDVLEPLKGLHMKVLHPAAGAEFDDANDYSLVILAEYAGRTIMLTGDLTRAGEDFDAAECDVLKVAHHGSAGSSSLKFLTDVNPRLALISASKRNRYGLPAAALMARLKYIDARVMNTADCGDITVHISPEGAMTARGFVGGE